MADLQTGNFINNRYEVVRCLGRGAMGVVYLVEDIIKSHRRVALKVLNSENLDVPDVWSNGEYQAPMRLRHPNLARVYDFGRVRDSKDFYIAIEPGIRLVTSRAASTEARGARLSTSFPPIR